MQVNSRLRRVVASIAGAAAIVLIASGCTADGDAQAAQPAQVTGDLPADTVTALQAAVDQGMAAAGASGAIVGVWAPWAGAWVAGIGETGPGSGEPVTTDMAFRIATMTRPMTCDALYGLVAENVVELDDPVSKWVQSSPDLENVTLKQLCDNTSGLARSRDALMPNVFRTPERVWNWREVAATGLGRPRTEPGIAVTDSDTGYILLGLALQNATGQTPAELIRRYATSPLGLQHTSLPGGEAAAPGDPALRGWHSSKADREAACAAPSEITELSASIGATDAGAVSTIAELGIYAEALAEKVKGDDGKLTERWAGARPVNPDADSWYQYAGGTYIAGSLVGQQGSLPGYLSSAWSDVDSGLTVAVVLNNSAASGALISYLARELAAIASKAPARSGETAPASGLPWTAEDYHARVADKAVCPIDSAE